MTTENAVIPADSAPATEVSQSEATPEQISDFWRSGELPRKPESGPAKKPVADSAPQAKEKLAVSASDSATDKETQPHRKTKEDTEKRFQELLDRVKKAEERAEAAERRSTEKREPSQTSQPAPKVEEPQAPPSLKPFLEKFFADEKNKGKSYEEGVEAWSEARDKFRDSQHDKKLREALAQEQNRLAQQNASKELQTKLEEANQRYGKEEVQKIFPALETILKDEQIPQVIKVMLNRSDVVIDLLYAIGKDNVQKFQDMAKSDPAAALEHLVELQSDVRKALKAPPKKDEGEPKAEAAPEKPRTPPKPPAEVGGRGAVTESPDKAAARSGNFANFDAEMRRKYQPR